MALQQLSIPLPDQAPLRTFAPARFGFMLALACAIAMLMSGIGYRFGLWHFRTGFMIMRWAVYGGIAAGVLCLVGMLAAGRVHRRRGRMLGLLGLLIAVPTVALPWLQWRTAQSVPMIHDITTDPDNPPKFVELLPIRKDVDNGFEYGGKEIADQQKKAYPDLAPLQLDAAPDVAFERASNAAKAMDWDIVASMPSEGRLEATATSLLFGFKDDIVVRITPEGKGSRIDVRSESRVGKSDLGVNARRIREFLGRVASSTG